MGRAAQKGTLLEVVAFHIVLPQPPLSDQSPSVSQVEPEVAIVTFADPHKQEGWTSRPIFDRLANNFFKRQSLPRRVEQFLYGTLNSRGAAAFTCLLLVPPVQLFQHRLRNIFGAGLEPKHFPAKVLTNGLPDIFASLLL